MRLAQPCWLAVVFLGLLAAVPARVEAAQKIGPVESPADAPVNVEVVFVVESKLPEVVKVGGSSYKWWRLMEVGVVITNTTSYPIYVQWDRSALIFGSSSFRVIHKGVRLIDRDKPQAPTAIGPGSAITDLLWPAEWFYWREGSRYSPGGWEREGRYVDKGERIRILLAWETEGTIKSGVWTFEFTPENAEYLKDSAEAKGAGLGSWFWLALLVIVMLGALVGLSGH